MREKLLQKILGILTKNNYQYSFFSNSCFDIATKGKYTFLIKAYSNIDSIRESQALELEKIAYYINAIPLIIGEKSKVFELKNDIFYDRYGINVITVDTFEEMVAGEKIESKRYFKGNITADIDQKAFSKTIEKLNKKDIIDNLKISRDSLKRYEKGKPASLPIAKALEKYFDKKIIKQIDFEEINSKFREDFKLEKKIENRYDKIFSKCRDIGFDIELFKSAPFQALDKSNERLILSQGLNKRDIAEKVSKLQMTKKVYQELNPAILTEKSKIDEYKGIPIISKKDLDDYDYEQLIRKIKKKDKKKWKN